MSPDQIFDLLTNDASQDLEQIIGTEKAAIVREFIPSGMVTEEDLTYLANVVDKMAPENSLEIGLASASTTITIMAAKQGRGMHEAFDPGQTKDYDNLGTKRIARAGLTEAFKLTESFSYIGLPALLASSPKRYDFAFIDSNHMFDHTLIEWFYIDKLLNIGGVVGFDDVIWPMVHAAVNFVEANCAYKFYKPNDRTWFGVKMRDDARYWFDYKPFVVPWGSHYEGMINRVRKQSGF